MKEKQSIKLIYFDNGLVKTNILLNVMNDETPKEAFEKNGLEAKQCPRCAVVNGNNTSFCRKCGLPLDDKTAMAYQQITSYIDEIITKKATENPQDLVEIIKTFSE